jgi:hypothetical protein
MTTRILDRPVKEAPMSRLVDRRPYVAPSVVLVLRILGAALLAAMAGIHLYLWSIGFKNITGIGPAFLVNTVAGFGMAVAVLLAPRRLLGGVAAAGALLLFGTFAALMLAMTVGLFGYHEGSNATLFWPTVIVEVTGTAVLAVLAGVRARESAPAVREAVAPPG